MTAQQVRPADRAAGSASAHQDLLGHPSGDRPGHRRPHRPPAAGAWREVRDAPAPHGGPALGPQRVAMVGYYEDGPNLVTLAMNGWGKAEPAWWLNLQALPVATVELPDGSRVGPRSCGHRRRAGAPLGDLPGLPRLGLRPRCPRGPSTRRDRDRRPRAEGWAGPMTDTTTIRVGGAEPRSARRRARGRRLRPRHLLVVPGLAIAILANEVGKANGVGHPVPRRLRDRTRSAAAVRPDAARHGRTDGPRVQRAPPSGGGPLGGSGRGGRDRGDRPPPDDLAGRGPRLAEPRRHRLGGR